MNKIILTMLLWTTSLTQAQFLNHSPIDKPGELENDRRFFTEPNVTNKDNGITDVNIGFEDQNKNIYLEKVNLKYLFVIKGNKILPKYLTNYVRGCKIINIPLEWEYILKYKNFIIESKDNNLFINKRKIDDSITINKNNVISWKQQSYSHIIPLKEQSLSCLNRNIKLNTAYKNKTFSERNYISTYKINYGKNNLFPVVEFRFKDQLKTIFFESIDLNNIKIIKGDKSVYDEYIRNYYGYNAIDLSFTNDYIIKADSFVIESKGNQLFLNKKEICFNAIIKKNGDIMFEVDDYMVDPKRIKQ